MENTRSRYSLRDLPLPAKLVVSVFLMAVALGYCWAVMQLHFRHAEPGEMMPGTKRMVNRFSGVNPPWEKEEAAVPAPENKPEEKKNGKNGKNGPPKMVAGAKIKSIIETRCMVCHMPDGDKPDVPMTEFADIAKLLDPSLAKNKLHNAIKTDSEENWNKDSMAQAFTKKSFVRVEGENDGLEWKDFLRKYPEKEAQVRAEREIERQALILWIEAGAPEEAYTKDAFPLPDGMGDKLNKDMRIQSMPAAKVAADAGDAAATTAKKRKNAKDRQLSVASLTQSTHAHLLSFSMLWALTGIVFAFTSYPIWMRCSIAPLVLVVQVIDISFWWLARLPDVGPYFAVSVIGTGSIVALGLTTQIVLSLFNMYGGKGKVVLLLLFAIGGAGGGLVYTKYIAPHIAAEKDAG